MPSELTLGLPRVDGFGGLPLPAARGSVVLVGVGAVVVTAPAST